LKIKIKNIKNNDKKNRKIVKIHMRKKIMIKIMNLKINKNKKY
jgi:hypothetical protein